MGKQAFEVAELPAGSGRWYWRERTDNEFHGAFGSYNDAESAAANAVAASRKVAQAGGVMTTPAFTGGRWYAKRGVSQMVSEDTTIWIAPSQNTDGSRWFVFADADEHGENEATANLIAAAPELLEALTDLLDNAADIDVSAESDDCALSDFVRSMDKARAAIAKAQGGAA